MSLTIKYSDNVIRYKHNNASASFSGQPDEFHDLSNFSIVDRAITAAGCYLRGETVPEEGDCTEGKVSQWEKNISAFVLPKGWFEGWKQDVSTVAHGVELATGVKLHFEARLPASTEPATISSFTISNPELFRKTVAREIREIQRDKTMYLERNLDHP